MSPDQDRPLGMRLARAFVYAGRGVRVASRDRMMRVHLTAALVTIGTAACLGVSRIEWAVLALTIGTVIALEAMNSAIEATVDLVSPDAHPLAAQAKDLAAGAVLIASLAAAVVGLLICGPRLIAEWGSS